MAETPMFEQSSLAHGFLSCFFIFFSGRKLFPSNELRRSLAIPGLVPAIFLDFLRDASGRFVALVTEARTFSLHLPTPVNGDRERWRMER